MAGRTYTPEQREAAEAARTAAQDALKLARKTADQKQLQLKSAEAKITDLEGKLNTCDYYRECFYAFEKDIREIPTVTSPCRQA